MTDAATARDGDDGDYSGLVSAFRYAFARSDSLLFRSYVVASAVVGAFVSLVLLFTLTQWFTETMGESALTTTSNAFLGVIELFILVPLFAPVILVARRRRRRPDAGSGYDRSLAALGYLFLAAVFVGLVGTVPPDYQDPNAGPVATALYAIPTEYALVIPVVPAALIWLAHRRYRRRNREEASPTTGER